MNHNLPLDALPYPVAISRYQYSEKKERNSSMIQQREKINSYTELII